MKINKTIQNLIKDPSWKSILKDEFTKPYFKKLSDFIYSEYLSHKIFPNHNVIFDALNICPFDNVKVVIIGQDPYHNDKQAMGLSFSVPSGTKLPPSLKNIFKEILNDVGSKTEKESDKNQSKNGDLSRWAKQGVVLLNSILTVRENSPGSHSGCGWEEFTDVAIRKISSEHEHIVFLLWGNYAKQKASLIDKTKHLVLETTHPSPFSANRGFFESKHFSKTNKYLKKYNITEINWH